MFGIYIYACSAYRNNGYLYTVNGAGHARPCAHAGVYLVRSEAQPAILELMRTSVLKLVFSIRRESSPELMGGKYAPPCMRLSLLMSVQEAPLPPPHTHPVGGSRLW